MVLINSMTYRNNNVSQGQTILEILLALTIILLVVTGVLVIEVYAMKNAQFSSDKSIAVTYANQQLERIKVLRDTGHFADISTCTLPCYINPLLTPVAITPTGKFSQTFTLTTPLVNECPLPDVVITPVPTVYKVSVKVNWSQNVPITPPWEIETATCVTD